MSTLIDFRALKKKVLGYIRTNSITDADYNDIRKEYERISQVPPKNVNMLDWLYYRANTNMFSYYYNKQKQYKANLYHINLDENQDEYLKKVKLKCISLYIKICNSQFTAKKKCKKKYQFPYINGEEDILYDVLFVYEELILDLMNINLIESHPHESLIFCYKYLIDGWGSKDILFKRRKKTLDKFMIDFVNQYSEESGLPAAAVLLYFYPMEEELHKGNKHSTKLNSYFSPIDIVSFFTNIKKRHFVKEIVRQRVNLIDKWSERIKERLVRHLIRSS